MDKIKTNTKAKVLPEEPKGTESPNALWASVGEALSRWEELQRKLAFVFLHVTHCPNNYALLRAFGTNMQVISKVDSILYAAEASLNGELLERTKALLNLVKAFNDRRNDIAHGVVMQDFGTKGGCYLRPTYTTSKKFKENYENDKLPAPEYSYTAKQIALYSLDFNSLGDEADDLRESIEAHFKLHPSQNES